MISTSDSQPNTAQIFDVAIAGGGLGGACAAIALSQRGFQVLLLESGTFPRHKVCGEFLSPESKKTFARLGVLDAIIEAGATEINHARIVTRGAQTTAPIAPAALSLSRWKLDPILWNAAAQAGATTLQSTAVRAFERDGEMWRVQTSRGEFQARAALSATGRRALKWADAPAKRDSQSMYAGFKIHFHDCDVARGVIELHAARGGYCGLSQVEDGIANACLLARYDAIKGRSPAEFWSALLHEMPLLRARMKEAKPAMDWLATGNVSFERFAPLRVVAAADDEPSVLCCGDAAGYIHPLTGDGMAMAARGGELAAVCLAAQLRGELSERDAHGLYARAWHREFDARLRWSSLFQSCLIEPRRAAPALALLQTMPFLARRAVQLTRGA